MPSSLSRLYACLSKFIRQILISLVGFLRNIGHHFFLICLFLICLPVSSAQVFPQLEGFVTTDSDNLDVAAINQAAQRLHDKGVTPIVIFMEGDVGQNLDEASAYFDRALESYGLRQNGVLQKNLFAIFVGTNPLPESDDQRPIFIFYENTLFPVLEAMAGSKDVDTFIREDLMIPKLQEGNFTGAFTSVFESVGERLPTGQAETSEPVQPQQTTPPPTEPEVTTQPNILQRFWWLGVPVLALLAFLGLRPRSRAVPETLVTTESSQPLDDASKLKTIKRQLSERLSDLRLALPTNPENQTEMVLLTAFLEGQHPEELTQLRQDYNNASETLRTISEQAATYQQQTASVAEQLSRYEALLTRANEVKSFTASLNDKWQALNRELAAIPDKLSALRGTLQQLKASYKERPDFLTADEVLKPLEQDISEVETVQQANESLKALRMLDGVQDNIALVSDSITRLMDADNHLDTFESQLPSFQTQGFKLYKFAERIPDVRQDMAIALGLIKQGEYKVLDAQVDEVMEQTSTIVDGAVTFTELHKVNAERLKQLETLGEEIKTQLDKSAEAFTAFNDFAPSSWRDVRGNGAEAQNAANRAHELWEQASDDNALTDSQEFEHAKTSIEQAFTELEQAKTLLAAVNTRLHDLQTAKATAKDQLALVEKDIADFQTTLRRPEVDRDVSKQPEAKLVEAASLVEKARAEFSQSLPDWLVVMQRVQSADRVADEAFALIRSEQETMERCRVRVNSEKVEAQTSLQRLQNYLQVHHSDMTQATSSNAEQLRLSYQQAESKEQSAGVLSEDMLGQMLEQTATLFDQVQQQADTLFIQAEKDFNDVETSRKGLAERLTSLQTRVNEANSQLINAGVTPSPLQRQLYTLANSLPTLTSSDRAALESALATLQSLEQEMAVIDKNVSEEINAVRSEQRRREDEYRVNDNVRDTYSWGGFGIPSPPRTSSPWGGSRSPSSSSSSGSSWSSRSSPSSSSHSSSSSSRSSSSSSSRSSSWGGSGKKSGGGW
jgi:chromosome segregation ATPase